VQEIEAARRLRFQPGTMLVFDRAYIDYAWFEHLTRQSVFFVTRLRSDAHYRVEVERSVPQRGPIPCDQVIRSGSHWYRQQHLLRRLEVALPDGEPPLVLLTNHLGLGPTTVARLHRERWQI